LTEVVVFSAVVVLVEIVVLVDVAVFVEGVLVTNFVTVCFCLPVVPEVLVRVLTDLVLVSLAPQRRNPRALLVGATELELVSLRPQKRNPRALGGGPSLERAVDVDDDKKFASTPLSSLAGLSVGRCVPSEKGRRRSE